MLNTLDDVVRRLVDRYKPDRIILFGSRARDGGHQDSDFDLVIIKETDARPIDRRAEVERLLADRRVPLDLLVYTPAELRTLHALGSSFIEELMETGRVLYMRKATEAWLRECEEEHRMATLLLDHGLFRGTCLHSQQAVEKGLKAFLIEQGARPARTHDVVELRGQVVDRGWTPELSVDDAVWLNSVYRARYPTEEGLLPHGDPTAEDARRAATTVGCFLDDLRRRLAG